MEMNLGGVLLYTDEGVKLLCRTVTGILWTPEKCFKFCNSGTDFDNTLKANKLTLKSVLINKLPKRRKDWYKDPNNFKKVDLSLKT